MGRYVKVAGAADLAPGQGKLVEVEGRRIALFNVGGNYHAMDDECPHQGGPLSEGELEGTKVACPWHAAVFEITTGAVEEGPATEGVRSYPVRVSGRDLEIEVDA